MNDVEKLSKSQSCDSNRSGHKEDQATYVMAPRTLLARMAISAYATNRIAES